jgi:cytidyltransferase-like protein
MTTVLTIGTFDLFHAGHAAFLKKCERLGDLTVGVNSDRFLVDVYGKRKPLFNQVERLGQVRAVGYSALLNDGPGRSLVQRVRPNYLAISTDWLYPPKDYLKQIDLAKYELEALAIDLVFIPHTDGVSTTSIIERVSEWQQIIE